GTLCDPMEARAAGILGVPEGEKVEDARTIEPTGAHARALEHPGLGAEPPGSCRVAADEERLLAEAVAADEHATATRIVDGDRPHPVAAAEDRLPPLEVPAQQHLGVPGRGESVARSLKRRAKLEVVVDLP